MEPPKFVDEIQKKMAELLESSPAKDIERNAKAAFSSMLGKMDLVTREEFDVQREVLARAREQLARLEARITELETALAQNKGAGKDQ
ncbi:accessory factor UbiK family protein [Niveibacterium sp. 24ML]|uniref:accessory factor UbiK family protein n=1 Tax=Niveibacterium sp. 24ML TaxID=2985512 RepID=UPI002270F4A4|nr:accessory factor UbiK family protein [Niveibacterium sp. 24ML]MCX9155455.1 accessory factor UbiK family protein [Niveibacterium sp. 24ML]